MPRLRCCSSVDAAGGSPRSHRTVSIVDGDTLDIHDERICLWGIDAPESTQHRRGRDRNPSRCGALAANTLDAFSWAQTVRCTLVDGDRYRRIVARCKDGRTDLGQMLVSRGLPIEQPQSSHGYYTAFSSPCAVPAAASGPAASSNRRSPRLPACRRTN